MNWVYLSSLGLAFVLGAAHALEPGHGKTLIAAYLTGTRGRVWDALLLGLLVTIFHTLSSFAIALVAIFVAQQFVHFETDLVRFLQVLSGLVILWIGGTLFYRRFVRDKDPAECECHVHHHHDPDHTNPTLLTPKTTSLKEVVSLGFASGVTPCPTSLAILVASVTIGGFGKLPEALMMLVTFSVGLSSVLVVLGLILIFSTRTLDQRLGNTLVNRDSRFPIFISQLSIMMMIGLGCYLIFSGIFLPVESLLVDEGYVDALMKGLK